MTCHTSPQTLHNASTSEVNWGVPMDAEIRGTSDPPIGGARYGNAVAAKSREHYLSVASLTKSGKWRVKRGEEYFQINCATCHGPTGGGDGPIAAPNGPIAGVLPIGPGSPMGFSLTPGLTDGHIYSTISLGRGRMPSYKRIPPDGRWDIVNYIRDLNGQGGR